MEYTTNIQPHTYLLKIYLALENELKCWSAAHDSDVNMMFRVKDHITIENLHKHKAYGVRKLVREFPEKGCDCLNVLLLFSYILFAF